MSDQRETTAGIKPTDAEAPQDVDLGRLWSDENPQRLLSMDELNRIEGGRETARIDTRTPGENTHTNDENTVEGDEPLTWQVLLDDPADPFTARLTFFLGEEEILWWNLDPYGLRDLLAALRTAQRAQAAIVAGTETSASTTPSVIAAALGSTDMSTKRRTRSGSQAASQNRSWFARHKVLTFLLGLCGFLFLISFVPLAVTTR